MEQQLHRACVFRPQALPRPPAPVLALDPGPGLRPQFVFDGPSPNLYLAALAVKLYLQTLAS